MKTGLFTEGVFICEEQCPSVPGSDLVCMPLTIKKLMEKTDDYEIYTADCPPNDFEFQVKVYLDESIEAGGKRLLGVTSIEYMDEYGDIVHQKCVFEILNNWRAYEEICRYGDISYMPGTYKEVVKQAKGFATVVGMEEIKQQLRDEVLWPLQHKELVERYRLHPLNGMLLYGPPGCGKTYIAQKFAEEAGMDSKVVTAGGITGCYIHQTAENIKEMFDNARAQAPFILCIEEIDALVPDRSKVGFEHGTVDLQESINEFLAQMNNCGKDGVFVIGTTNNQAALDKALLRTGRMDKIIYVGMPDEDTRKTLIDYYLQERPQEDAIDTAELARQTKGMNASDIEFLVNSVAMKAARTEALITFEMLSEQAKTQRRSVSMNKISCKNGFPTLMTTSDIVGFV